LELTTAKYEDGKILSLFTRFFYLLHLNPSDYCYFKNCLTHKNSTGLCKSVVWVLNGQQWFGILMDGFGINDVRSEFVTMQSTLDVTVINHQYGG